LAKDRGFVGSRGCGDLLAVFLYQDYGGDWTAYWWKT